VYTEGGFGETIRPRRRKESLCGRAIGANSKGKGSAQLRASVSLIRARRLMDPVAINRRCGEDERDAVIVVEKDGK
jgi:hypothetical protein